MHGMGRLNFIISKDFAAESCHRIETSHLICRINHFTIFNMTVRYGDSEVLK